MDFILQRNLEHILSVCSVPIPEIHLFSASNGEAKGRSSSREPGAKNDTVGVEPETPGSLQRDLPSLERRLKRSGSMPLEAGFGGLCWEDSHGRRLRPVAVTCGDVLGHRIIASASL